MITIDTAEPERMEKLLATSLEVVRATLNLSGYADYIFTDVNNNLRQIEREPATAIITRAVEVEDEIRRHYQEGSIMLLIVEGIILPHPDGCQVVEVYGHKVREMFFSRMRYEAVISWLFQLQEHGIEYIQTPSLEASAIAISSIYWNSQKLDEEHKMFRRHIKPATGWHPNPQIQSLMGLAGANLGEKKASQLVAHFKSIYGLCQADIADIMKLPGWGETSAKELLKALGKEV